MTFGVMPHHPVESLRDAARRPTSAMSEATLEHGYRRQLVDRRPCGCGVDISLYAEDDLALVVGDHNRSARHEAWAVAAGWR